MLGEMQNAECKMQNMRRGRPPDVPVQAEKALHTAGRRGRRPLHLFSVSKSVFAPLCGFSNFQKSLKNLFD